MCMSFVAVGRSLTIVSYVAFKMAALWFWTMFDCNPPIAHHHPLLWGGGILVDHWSTISSLTLGDFSHILQVYTSIGKIFRLPHCQWSMIMNRSHFSWWQIHNKANSACILKGVCGQSYTHAFTHTHTRACTHSIDCQNWENIYRSDIPTLGQGTTRFLDDKLPFSRQVRISCTKAARQFHALARISRYLNISPRSFLYNSFVRRNFNYCAVVWHFSRKKKQWWN